MTTFRPAPIFDKSSSSQISCKPTILYTFAIVSFVLNLPWDLRKVLYSLYVICAKKFHYLISLYGINFLTKHFTFYYYFFTAGNSICFFSVIYCRALCLARFFFFFKINFLRAAAFFFSEGVLWCAFLQKFKSILN